MDLLMKMLVFSLSIAFSSSYRLPTTVVPEHYKLDILTNLGDENNKFEFSGTIWIKTRCVHPTKNITLHSKNLDINQKEIIIKDITDNTSKTVEIADFKTDKENDFFVMMFKEDLNENHQYEIYMKYTGKLQDSLAGFYKSSYEDNKTKEKRYLATTQFQSTDARRAFPCFDEPAMKATFEISMGHKDKYSAISNMPQSEIEPMKEKEGWVWTKFEKSVPMSTYLVAFIVSDFGYEKSPENNYNNVTFKIWSRKDALDQVKFAGEVGPKFLNYYEKFFDIKFPLPKQDMIAVPDFGGGAMENWGLVTYRENYLLYDPEISSATSQHSVASVIAHELAHQWFGNLVTMKWWTDLWLNEGFATYMGALAVHHLFPQWNSLEEEAVNNLLAVFDFDALQNSHPVSVPVGHPREIDQIFDTIAYQKGSYLIRMMTLFLGEETHRKGVSKYLEKHKYGNAEQDDLWSSLTEQAHSDGTLPKNLTVKSVMDSWTLQTGYPVITVNRLYGKKSVELSQERFLRNNIKAEKTTKSCWFVPVSYTNEMELNFNDTVPKYWLPCTNEKQVIDGFLEDDKWVIFNIEAAGLYRVNYDEKNWNMLTEALIKETEKFPVLSRVQLIDDSSHLAVVGDIKYNIFFNLIKYLSNEDKYLPWKAALSNIEVIYRQVWRSAIYGNFTRYISKIIDPIYKKVGGLIPAKDTQDKLDTVKHQGQIVAWACTFNVGNCIADVIEKFEKFQSDPNNKDIIPKDLKGIIYCKALRHGGQKEWDFLWNRYKTSNVAAEKNSILYSLGCTREIWLLRRYLEWTIDPNSGIRNQDVSSVFAAVAYNEVGFYVAQNFIEDNLEKIHKILSPNSRRLSDYLSPIASQMISEREYEWMLMGDILDNCFKERRKAFIWKNIEILCVFAKLDHIRKIHIFVNIRNLTESNKKYFKEAKQGVDQSLETVKLNIQWQRKHAEDIKKFLEEFKD